MYKKLFYEAPESEFILIKIEKSILQGSVDTEEMTVTNPWGNAEEEDL